MMLRVVFLSLVLVSSLLAKPAKFSYVELDKAIMQTEDGKAAKIKIEKETTKIQKQLKSKEDSFKKEQSALEKKIQSLSKSEQEKQVRALQEKGQAAQAFFAKAQSDLQIMQKKTMEPILQRANLVLQKLESQGDYSYILNNNPYFMFYGKSDYDVTDSFVVSYEAAFGKAKTKAATKIPKAKKTGNLRGSQTLKLGYIDMQKAMAQLNDALKIKAKLQTEFQSRQSILGIKQQQMQKLQTELAGLKDSPKKDLIKQKEEALKKMYVEAQTMYMKMQQELSQMEQTEMAKLMESFRAKIAKLSEESDYTFVFNKSPNTLLYGAADLDITNIAIEKVNAGITKKGSLNGKTLQADKVKFAYVDIEQAMNQVKDGVKLQAKLKSARTSKIAEIKMIQKEVGSLEKKLNAQKSILKPKILEEKKLEVQKMKFEAEQKMAQFEQEMGMMQQKEMMQVLQKMENVFSTLGEKGKYTAIINKGPAALLLGKPSFDLTNEVIKKYNEAYSS